MIGTISLIRRFVRTGLVPEVEMPHLKASDLSWLSLREAGILIAMHIGVGVFYLIEVDKHVKRHASSSPWQLIPAKRARKGLRGEAVAE
jgi:hypothetical protein